MKTETFTLPSFLLCALFYDDRSGLSDEDEAALDKFTDDNLAHHKHFFAVSTGEDMGFMKYHDMKSYGILACDCEEVIFDIGE